MQSHTSTLGCAATHSCGRERFILHTRKNKLRCWKIQVISFFRKYFSGLVPALYISLTSRTRVSNARHLQHCNAGHTVTVSLSLYYYTHAVDYSFKKKKKGTNCTQSGCHSIVNRVVRFKTLCRPPCVAVSGHYRLHHRH